MNEAANLLVRTASALVERWRFDAFGGDLTEIDHYMRTLGDCIHRVGLSPADIDNGFAPNRSVVGFESLSKTVALVGTAIVASLEGIRAELRLRRDSAPRTDFRHRQESLDRAVNWLADKTDLSSRQAALDE